MVNMSAKFGALVALVGFFSIHAAAQNSTAVKASTYYLPKTETQFSVNVDNATNDIFIYFTSPAYSWVGFGFGLHMENSLMFILYPSSDGNNVTVSPRFGAKNAEPSFSPSINLEILPGTTISNDSMFILRAVCHNCRSWQNGALDVTSKKQPMIYAFGPGDVLQSNSPSANLRRHVRYGQFTMDLTAATGQGGVPSKSSATNGVTLVGDMVRDHDRKNLAHTVIGCLALFVLWPLNVLIAGFLKNIKIHIGVNIVIMAFLIISYAFGIATSSQFNRSKAFNSPHQIIAFISLLPLLLMSITPIPAISKLHSVIPRLHSPLVSTTFVLLILTGGVGLHLSSQIRPYILAYTAIALVVFVFTTFIGSCIRRRGSAYARANGLRRRRAEDDNEFMLQKMQDSRSDSQASLRGGVYAESREFGADGQRRVVGGGAMPGPQYLLNMHPGVPVHRW